MVPNGIRTHGPVKRTQNETFFSIRLKNTNHFQTPVTVEPVVDIPTFVDGMDGWEMMLMGMVDGYGKPHG